MKSTGHFETKLLTGFYFDPFLPAGQTSLEKSSSVYETFDSLKKAREPLMA